MPVRISEKNLFAAIVLLIAGIGLFLSSSITQDQIRVSEKGLMVAIASVSLIAISIKLFLHSYKNV